MWMELWPAISQPFLSLTHTLGKAFVSSDWVKWGRKWGSPFSLTRPPPHLSDTARWMEAGQIFPPVEALGPFWQVLSAHCKHPPQQPLSKKGLRCLAWVQFKCLGAKLGSLKFCSADDHFQRHVTSGEASVFYAGVSQTYAQACLFLTGHTHLRQSPSAKLTQTCFPWHQFQTSDLHILSPVLSLL